MRPHTRRRVTRLLVAVCSLAPVASQADPVQLPEVTVTGTREGELKSETPASVTVLRAGAIDEVKPSHPAELLGRVPGVAVMQTNGEGHTTGIRQPIGTSAVYLFLDHPLLVGDGGRVYLSWLTRADGYRLIPLEAAR